MFPGKNRDREALIFEIFVKKTALLPEMREEMREFDKDLSGSVYLPIVN